MSRVHLLVFALSAVTCLTAEEPLKLPAADGHEYTPLVVPGDKKAAVLFFVSPYCPTANTFIPEIKRIIADYSGSFICCLVHSDPDVKQTDVLQHTEMNEIKAPVLLDKDQALAKRLGAKITPEVVVVGVDDAILYQGRINDLYLGPTKRQRQATAKDLCDALDAIKEGRAVAIPQTEAMGCKIGGIR